MKREDIDRGMIVRYKGTPNPQDKHNNYNFAQGHACEVVDPMCGSPYTLKCLTAVDSDGKREVLAYEDEMEPCSAPIVESPLTDEVPIDGDEQWASVLTKAPWKLIENEIERRRKVYYAKQNVKDLKTQLTQRQEKIDSLKASIVLAENADDVDYIPSTDSGF